MKDRGKKEGECKVIKIEKRTKRAELIRRNGGWHSLRLNSSSSSSSSSRPLMAIDI